MALRGIARTFISAVNLKVLSCNIQVWDPISKSGVQNPSLGSNIQVWAPISNFSVFSLFSYFQFSIVHDCLIFADFLLFPFLSLFAEFPDLGFLHCRDIAKSVPREPALAGREQPLLVSFAILSILWVFSNKLPDYKFLVNYKPPSIFRTPRSHPVPYRQEWIKSLLRLLPFQPTPIEIR